MGGRGEGRSCLELKTDICSWPSGDLDGCRGKKKNVLKWDTVGLNSVSAREHYAGILSRENLGEEDFCQCWGRPVRDVFCQGQKHVCPRRTVLEQFHTHKTAKFETQLGMESYV